MNADTRKALIEKWLSLFGSSSLFTLCEVQPNRTGIDYSMNYSIEAYMDMNDNYPMGLYYTPNGFFGNKQVIGERLVRLSSEAEKYIATFFVDIDMKDTKFTDKPVLLEALIKIIEAQQLPVSYIVESGGGFHLYMFVAEDERRQIGQSIDFKLINESFAEFFRGGEMDRGGDLNNHKLEKLMRCPFTNHWKTGAPIMTKLYTYLFGELIEVTDPEQIVLPEQGYNFETIPKFKTKWEKMIEGYKDLGLLQEKRSINMSKIKTYEGNIKEQVKFVSGGGRRKLTLNLNTDVYAVDKLPIDMVIRKLVDYPKSYEGRTFTFIADGGFIHINYIDANGKTVEVYTPNGYKIDTERNYVNCFSFSSHPIEERPRGSPYSFLYYYFDKDLEKLREFVLKEFKINLSDTNSENLMPSISTGRGTIRFTRKGVIYRKENVDKKGNIVQEDVVLFYVPFIIKGVCSTNYSIRGESEIPILNYLIQRLDLDEELLIPFFPTKNAFNTALGKNGLIYHGNDMDILEFFNALNYAVNAGQIPTFDLRYTNGFHKDNFIIGKTIITKDFEMKEKIEGLYIINNPIQMVHGKTQITVSQFVDKVSNIFSERIAVLGSLSYIALFLGHNFWNMIKGHKTQWMLPALIFSGRTNIGKSTLISILKEGSMLHLDACKMSVKATSPQPLRQAGTDTFILHLEEFTGRIKDDNESIMRDIINKASSARGVIDGTNISYKYKASLIVDGERLPEQASVLNRCIIIPMFETDKKGTEGKIADMRDYAYLKDLIKKAYALDDIDILNAFKEAESLLLSIGIGGRAGMLYSYLIATAILFDVYDSKQILDLIKENIGVLSEVNTDGDELSGLLSDLIINRRVIPKVTYGNSVSREFVIEVPITSNILREKQIELIGILKKYKGHVSIMNNKMKININKENGLYSSISAYEQYFKT